MDCMPGADTGPCPIPQPTPPTPTTFNNNNNNPTDRTVPWQLLQGRRRRPPILCLCLNLSHSLRHSLNLNPRHSLGYNHTTPH
jgi:hypothetical protein